MSIIKIGSEDQYKKLIGYVAVDPDYRIVVQLSHPFSSAEKVSIVLFSAPWAEQCTQILDVFNELSPKAQFAQLQFIDVAAEDYSEISINHQIEAVPTVLFFRNGTALDRIDGIDIAALTTKCKSLAGVVEDEKTSLEERLKALINKSPLMVFVKGDRNTPRCGFSKQLIAILNDTGLVAVHT